MKKQLLQKLQKTVFPIVVVLSVILGNSMHAQIFNPAAFSEYSYPAGGGTVGVTTHSFTYTMGHIAYMSTLPPAPPPPIPPYTPAPGGVPLTDLTIHTFDDPGSNAGLSWISKATGSGTPGTIYDQGTILYPTGVQNIEASLMQDEMGFNMFINGTNAAWFVVVSYYNPAGSSGAGHYMDVYTWNRPAPWGIGGLTLMSTKRLSTIANYTRVSQDAHNTYGFCITWEDPTASASNGINFVFGFMKTGFPGVNISPAYTLAGTRGQTHPDVAFTHDSALHLQFIYYNRINGVIKITESRIPFQTGPGWSAPPSPFVTDVNTLPVFYPSGPLPDLKTRIDAPDHYSVENWAYTYIMPNPAAPPTPNNNIYVRFDNYNTPNFGVPATYTLTNGSLAIGAINAGVSGYNDWPVCSFDNTSSRLNVEWYTQYQPGFFGNIGGYVGIQMNEAGVITSPHDYLEVADASTGSNMDASNTPTIASSRQNDRTDYQHVAFANTDPIVGNEMQVKDRPWVAGAFKGDNALNFWANLYDHSTTLQPLIKEEDNISAYPNPFASKIMLNMSSGLIDKTLSVSVEDISGRTIARFMSIGSNVNTSLLSMDNKFANGTYFIKVATIAGDFNKVLKVQKIAE
jgi:hypothetical protein